MRLAAFTDYGLRVLIVLASTPERQTTTARLAQELAIPYNHLAKVVQDLGRGGYLATQRGAGGGMRLARAPEAIGLGEIVRFLEQRYAIVECFRADGGECLLTPGCRVRGRLAAAREAFLAELDKTSIAECAHPGPSAGPSAAPLLEDAGSVR
jgi:Rrf2 family nitric oxide-sensitive transcriptional repressor